MFLSVKKNTLVAIALVVITVVSLCLLIFPLSISSSADPLGKTIVIDAGHGGIDGGVQGVNTGTKESDINLAISRELKRVLQKNGYKVVMTRQNTDGLYGLSSKNKKQKDMQTRKEIIEQAKADLVVSIHQNQYPRMNVRGAQVFYAPGSETGKTMAEKMQAALNTNLEACTRTAHEGLLYTTVFEHAVASYRVRISLESRRREASSRHFVSGKNSLHDFHGDKQYFGHNYDFACVLKNICDKRRR